MKISRQLCLVQSLDREDAEAIYVHSAPISHDVFERYHLVIAKTFAEIYSQGLNIVAGPRVAFMILKRIAQEMGVWESPGGVKDGLVGEIVRLSNVAYCLPDGGWQTVPLQNSVSTGIISEQEFSEILGELAFFTCASLMHRRAELESILKGMAELWGGGVTSSSFTEFLNSLRTSTKGENTGEKQVAAE